MIWVRRLLIVAICIALIVVLLPDEEIDPSSLVLDEATLLAAEQLSEQFESASEPYYSDILNRWEEEQVQAANSTVTLKGSDMSAHSEQAKFEIGSYGGKNDVLIWNSDRSNWIEYEIEVPESGLYEIALTYQSYIDKSSAYQNYRAAVLAVSIDGAFPFREAKAISFPRRFKDEQPFKKDEFGDEIRPKPIELEEWTRKPFEDSEGAYSLPLRWNLSQGKHTLRFQTFTPIVIEKIELTPPTTIHTYAEVKQSQPDAEKVDGEVIIIEAENMLSKSDVAIQVAVDQDPLMTPDARNKTIFNAVGGTRWQEGSGSVTWTFTVPKDGYYTIGMRAFQSYQSNKKVFRKIYIDGKVPFQELLAYPFGYSTAWQGITLEDEQGKPYEFFLEQGEHTMTMTTTYSPYSEVLKKQAEVLFAIRDLSEDINTIVGGVDDPNRTWRVQEDFPELITQLEAIMAELKVMRALLLDANGEVDANSQALSTSITDVEDILEFPNDIPYKIEDLSMISTRIGSLTDSLTHAPLMLDKLYVAPVGTDMPRMTARWDEKMGRSVSAFFHSFSDDGRLSYDDEDVINVWVNYGRDYVNVIQEMADQYFTPETGIQVKVDLLPDENLLVMSNAAGRAPDVALGITEGRPIELAVRGAAEDLSQYPGFDELFEQYSPGSTLPYYYADGYYALPETQRFQVLFYRKDILQTLGLEVPDTWEDVIEMLPTLQQNGYNFHIPYNDYMTFLYQYGAEFYEEDGMASDLDSPEAFEGFKMLTDLFTIYGIERQVPSFYQHFRDGDMPIGIADVNMYLQMRVAAPELEGWWGMAPLPGVKQDNGEVSRWTGGNQTAAMMFEKTQHKDEAWKFIQWWLSAETQQRFGNDLEGFYGVAFRWNTANLEAFTQLPWNQEELNVMLEQWRWYKDIANIPGSYFISRELLNAWNRTVLSGQNYRDSLEEAVLRIDREIWRKANEFGYIDDAGQVVDTYDPPRVKEPWNGVDTYVIE
ncbi:extracellular solute-binding protein [Marinicrinis lubricantis]|uniref:Extracellular solute-binding protein n=1 Tax=Marinicrinis lubricantis TaxID=2086470 RepID=A0ABW1ILF0_9BACL